jgi:hypothetical protein
MLNLPLEPTDDRAKPIYKGHVECSKWLAQLQLTPLQMAHATLRTQLDEFNRYPASGLERLQTLEVLRETINYVQGEYAKKLVAKALPLNDIEFGILLSLTGMWQGMLAGYLRCLQAYGSGDKKLAPFGSLLCQRSMLYIGLLIIEHVRTGYEFDSELWRQLHAIYSFAEQEGLSVATVSDELSEYGRSSSCRSLYVKILLTCQARPEELGRSQQSIVDRWLSVWSMDITVDRTFAMSRGDAPPLAIDLSDSSGLQTITTGAPAGEHMRYLAMVPMSKLLRVKTILLQQGQSPQQLELGDGLTSAECIELLHHLHEHWCEPRPVRQAERQKALQEAQACYGLDGIYSYLMGRAYGQYRSGETPDAARKQAETFGRVVPDTPNLGYPMEVWQVEDASILGARLMRPGASSVRFAHGQIVATRTATDSSYVVGVTIWVSITRAGHLHLGIRHLPGSPQPIIVRNAAATPGAANTPSAGLLLPAVPELNIPASLLIRRNIFQGGRALELTLADNKKMIAKLGFSVEKGVDYERVSFTPA